MAKEEGQAASAAMMQMEEEAAAMMQQMEEEAAAMMQMEEESPLRKNDIIYLQKKKTSINVLKNTITTSTNSSRDAKKEVAQTKMIKRIRRKYKNRQ